MLYLWIYLSIHVLIHIDFGCHDEISINYVYICDFSKPSTVQISSNLLRCPLALGVKISIAEILDCKGIVFDRENLVNYDSVS